MMSKEISGFASIPCGGEVAHFTVRMGCRKRTLVSFWVL